MKNKGILVGLLAFFVFSMAFGYIQIDRQMESYGYVGKPMNVSLTIVSTDPGSNFDVVEALPEGWQVDTWYVKNYGKNDIELSNETRELFDKQRSVYAWQFTEGYKDPITLTYTVTPESEGDFEFASLWVYPGGFDRSFKSMRVLVSEVCGNFICEPGEGALSCFVDCGLPHALIIVAIAVSVLVILMHKKGHVKLPKRKLHKKPAHKTVKAKTEKAKDYLDELKLYLKHGLKRGYTFKEIKRVLRNHKIDTKLIDKFSKDEELVELERVHTSKDMELAEHDYLIGKLDKVITKLKREQ